MREEIMFVSMKKKKKEGAVVFTLHLLIVTMIASSISAVRAYDDFDFEEKDVGVTGMTGGMTGGGEEEDLGESLLTKFQNMMLDDEDEDDFYDQYEKWSDTLSEHRDWNMQVIGSFAVDGISALAWRETSNKFPEALKKAVVNMTGIDDSQFEFTSSRKDDDDDASEDFTGSEGYDDDGEEEEKEKNGEEEAKYLRFRQTVRSSFSVPYAISLRTDEDDVDAQEIIDTIVEQSKTREFSDSFRQYALQMNPDNFYLTQLKRGTIVFAATAKLNDSPVSKPTKEIPTDKDKMWAPVGLDDWSQHENGVVQLHNQVTTTLRLVALGHTLNSGDKTTMKAAIMAVLEDALHIRMDKHLSVELNILGQPLPGDWGGSASLMPDVFEIKISCANVPASFDEGKLNGAMTHIIRQGLLVDQLCRIVGGSWCHGGASIEIKDLEPSVPGTVNVQRPESLRVNGVSGVLYPYFH